MNALRRAGATTVVWLVGTLPALAATGARVDHSGLLVWAFLGLCALIVLAQAVPAALLLVEMARGALMARKLARAKASR